MAQPHQVLMKVSGFGGFQMVQRRWQINAFEETTSPARRRRRATTRATLLAAASWLTWCLLSPCSALAQEGVHKSPHEEDTHRIVGVKAVQLTTMHQGEVKLGAGGGFALEHSLLHGWLEAEFVSAAIQIDRELLIPIDLILKKPLHFGIFCPYFGGGLAMTVLPSEGQAFLGGSLVVGSYLWLWGDIGLDIELEYNVLNEDGAVHEIIAGVGPSLRF